MGCKKRQICHKQETTAKKTTATMHHMTILKLYGGYEMVKGDQRDTGGGGQEQDAREQKK